MSLWTLPGYLIGCRDAIVRIAASRHAVWVGLLFVLSAGFAREYDREDLLHEPWHALLPLAASLGTSVLLYGMLWSIAWKFGDVRRPLLGGYVSFLALYWMTAPMAWLYAVPWERFCSPAAAVQWNLVTLGVVALWRVLLMIRVAHVFFGLNYALAATAVLLFADAVAVGFLFAIPLPTSIIFIMGGIVQLSESEAMLRDIVLCARVLSVLTLPVWLIGFLLAIGWNYWGGARKESRVEEDDDVPRPVHPLVWALAGLAVFGGLALLPIGQPPQQLRHKVETALAEGDVAEGIEVMSRHRREDFPPHWEPPPRIAYREFEPPMIDVLEVLIENDTPHWVREIFLEKIWRQGDRESPLHRPVLSGSLLPVIDDLADDELTRYHRILARLPEGARIAALQRLEIEKAAKTAARRQAALDALLQLAGGPVEPPEPPAQSE